jgi:hypothetical protein
VKGKILDPLPINTQFLGLEIPVPCTALLSELIAIKVFERLSTLLMGSVDGLMMSAASLPESV